MATDDLGKEWLLQVHLQEYQALMNRGTTLYTLLYAIGGFFLTYAILIITEFDKLSGPIVWPAIAGGQLILFFGAWVQHEAYLIVAYQEGYLRAEIKRLVGVDYFFKYEHMLKDIRRTPTEIAWLIGLALVLIVTSGRYLFNGNRGFDAAFADAELLWNILGLLANILIFVGIIYMLIKGFNFLKYPDKYFPPRKSD